MPKSRFYKILGLDSSASEKEVKKQYRILVKKYHPDRNSSPNAQEKFIQITEAYDIILDPNYISTKNKLRTQKTDEEKKKEREERMKKAKERYRYQEMKEKLENIRYFNSLTTGKKWLQFKFIALIGFVVACLLFTDLILPHQTHEEEIKGYSLRVLQSTDGSPVGIIYTRNNHYYYVKNMNYHLFGETRYIDIESTRIFNSPIFLIAKRKTSRKYYDVSFTIYNSTFVLITLFLLPLFTIWYKRMNILFTILYHICYYGVTAVIIVFTLIAIF